MASYGLDVYTYACMQVRATCRSGAKLLLVARLLLLLPKFAGIDCCGSSCLWLPIAFPLPDPVAKATVTSPFQDECGA